MRLRSPSDVHFTHLLVSSAFESSTDLSLRAYRDGKHLASSHRHGRSEMYVSQVDQALQIDGCDLNKITIKIRYHYESTVTLLYST